MGVEGGQDVHAPAEYDGKAGNGRGVLTSISLKQVQVEQTTSAVAEERLYLSFRIFETSTPVRLVSRVLQATPNSFCAELSGMQPATRNVLRMVLSKLKVGGESVRSKTSLMKD